MIFLDVTEIYALTRKAAEVTGVQRVVLEVAFELLRTGRARPVLTHPAERVFRAVDPAVFSGEALYDAAAYRAALGVAPKLRNLAKYPGRGLKRALMAARAGAETLLPRRLGPAVDGPVDMAGGTWLYLGGFSQAAWLCPRARAQAADLRLAVMVHDVIPLQEDRSRSGGEAAAFLAAFDAAVDAGATLLCNSLHTRRDVEALIAQGVLRRPARPLRVTPLAHELRRPTREAARPAAARQPYLLTVGGVHGRKNVRLLLEAALLLRAMGAGAPALNIVCAGRIGAHGPAMLASDPRFATLADSVAFIDEPDQATLAALYEGCEALVFPSRYEGWGLPVGEALWLGRPVFASEAASVPEVGGDRALYFPPDDAGALAARLRDHFSDARLRDAMAARRAAPGLRSWAQAADAIADAATA